MKNYLFRDENRTADASLVRALCLCLFSLASRADDGWRSVFTSNGITGGRVTHGSEIYYGSDGDTIPLPDNLEIHWSGNRFQLNYLMFARCTGKPAISRNLRYTAFASLEGCGKGSYNGQPGANIHFKFTCGGEPGTGDTAEITI